MTTASDELIALTSVQRPKGSAQVVLYYPKVNPDGEEHDWLGFPFALLFVAASLMEHGYKCRIVDERISPDPLGEVSEAIRDGATHLGVSTMTGGQLRGAMAISSAVKDRFPDVRVTWGGWHPSLLPEQPLQEEYVDYVVRGQGQGTYAEVVKELDGGAQHPTVEGVSYKVNGQVVHNETRKTSNLKTLPPIPYHLVDISRYIYAEETIGAQRCISYVSSQGCSHACAFCSIYAVYRRGWTPMKADRVLDDIAWFIEEWDVDGVFFSDDNFVVNPPRVRDFATGILDRGYKIGWGADARADQLLKLDEETWEAMAESGCRKIFIGVESGSPDVLELINKEASAETQLRAIEKCHNYGIVAACSLMVGFPLNPRQDIADTVQLAEQILTVAPEAETMLYVFLPYPGTPLYEVAQEYGMKMPETVGEWSGYSTDTVHTPWIDDRLKHLIERWQTVYSYRERSGQIENVLEAVTVRSGFARSRHGHRMGH